MPTSNTALESALNAARQPHHTDDDIRAVLAIFGDTPSVSADAAGELLSVAEEIRRDGKPPVFGEFGARITMRDLARQREFDAIVEKRVREALARCGK